MLMPLDMIECRRWRCDMRVATMINNRRGIMSWQALLRRRDNAKVGGEPSKSRPLRQRRRGFYRWARGMLMKRISVAR